MDPVRVRRDDSLRATVISRRPLVYGGAPQGHVRAGSAVARFGKRLAVVQDDADVVALVEDGRVHALRIAGVEGAERKATKLDLEACVVDGDRLVAFGSGSTPARERIVLVADGEPRVLAAPQLYDALRREVRFSGGSLNIEGAVLRGETLLLFQRGNGARTEASTPVNATCEIAWRKLVRHLFDRGPAPALRKVTQYELGEIAGVPLSFTDAAQSPTGGIVFLAAAEGSQSTYDDGPVTGVAVGVLDVDAPRLTLLRDAAGQALREKAEGITFDPARPDVAHVVTDRDDPRLPCELLEVVLEGFG